MNRRRHPFTLSLLGLIVLTGCVPEPSITISAPANGTFFATTGGTMTVTGSIGNVEVADASVTVNGVPVTVAPKTKTFSVTVLHAPDQLFQPIVAEVVQLSKRKRARDRVVVIHGPSIAADEVVDHGLALGLTEPGLAALAPVAAAEISGNLDIVGLLPSEPFLVDDVEVTIVQVPAPTVGGLNLGFDPRDAQQLGAFTVPPHLVVETTLLDFNLSLRVDRGGLFGGVHCSVGLSIPAIDIRTRHRLRPDAQDPRKVDVSQDLDALFPIRALQALLGISVEIGTVHTAVDCTGSGTFTEEKERRVRDAIVSGLSGAIADALRDPDGIGPVDAPVAAAIETALADIQLTGTAGAALGASLATSFDHITESDGAIDVGVDAHFATGYPTLDHPFTGPALTRSLAVPDAYPSEWRTTPPDQLDYDLAIGASATALNQLLMVKTRKGELNTELLTLGTLPLTAESLSILVPEFDQLPPETPLRIRVRPTIAPVFTGNPGPHGELAELALAQMSLEVVQTVQEPKGPRDVVWLSGLLDADLGIDLAFDADGTTRLVVGASIAGDFSFFVLGNAIGADPDAAEAIVSATLAAFMSGPDAPPLASFPVPEFPPPLSVAPDAAALENGYLILFGRLTT